MDLYKALADLHAEKERLDRVIASMEKLQNRVSSTEVAPQIPKRRGRKGMNASERVEVSNRMKTYWINRRKAQAAQRS